MQSSSDTWNGTQTHPFAEFAPYKLKREERLTLEAAYNAQEQSSHFRMPDDIWPDLDVLLSQHRTQREEWKGDQPKTRIDQALFEADKGFGLEIRKVENLMFNNWLRPQFEPDGELWAKLSWDIEEARSRLRSYRSQIEGKRFRRATKRKLHAETTEIFQNILSHHGLSLVTLGTTQRQDIRRKELLREFFQLAEDPIDDVRERRLLNEVAKAERQQEKKKKDVESF
jgi:hypothetical protein